MVVYAMKEVEYNVLVYDWDQDEWVEMLLLVKPGMFSMVRPDVRVTVGDKIMALHERSRFLPLRNWLRGPFSFLLGPILCLVDRVTVEDNGECLKIDIGFPFEEPYRIKFPPGRKEDLNKIKSVWASKPEEE